MHSNLAGELGEKLAKSVKTMWPDGIARLTRNEQRRGLVHARLRGVAEASGDVIIFLDAHCEATIGW